MAVIFDPASGRVSARDVAVWDPLVRLIHWSLALMILLNGAITDGESKLHEWVGYAALGLVGLRMIWAIIGPRHARFSAFPPSVPRAIRYARTVLSSDRTVHLSHNPLGALMVYNLWLAVIALGMTGYMMTTIRFFGLGWIEDMHELIFNWLVISVALHVAGVAFDTWRSGVNLVRAMVVARKRIPQETEVK
jgi:cytochrome b